MDFDDFEDDIFLNDDLDILDIIDFGFPRKIYQRENHFQDLYDLTFFWRFRLMKNTVLFLLELIEGDLEYDNNFKYVCESSRQDQTVRSQENELSNLESELEKEKRLKEAALAENKRLHNDIGSLACDSRDARNELEICKRQVEDLKRQLQHYVAEIKRTEDLITNKELERNELLDQFKSLSQEANVLESNNHTLETEANQCKVQLSVALDHSTELERRVEHQENIVRSYEKQIAEMSAQVARLEVQLKQSTREQEQCYAEMKQMRDLCKKLDKDKDTLRNELYNKEERRSQNDRITDQLNSEMGNLRGALEEEKNRLEGVEKLLNEARRETTGQRLLNQDLQHEINRLRQKVTDLEEKLLICETKLKDHNPKVVRTEYSNRRGSDQSIPDGYSSPTKRRTSISSTRTLTQPAKVPKVIDLTALDTFNKAFKDATFTRARESYDAGSLKTSAKSSNDFANVTTLERCDEYSHQKLLANVAIGQSVLCPFCKEPIKLFKKVEIGESFQTSLDNAAKCVDFSVKGHNRNAKMKTFDPSKDQASIPSRSVTSFKTLTWENNPSIRMNSRGQTDLLHDNGKIVKPSDDDRKEARPPLLPRFTEVRKMGSDPSIWSEFNEQMVNDYLRESDNSNNTRMNSAKICRCMCPNCFSNMSLSEPDIRIPKDMAACLKEKPKQLDRNDAVSITKRGGFGKTTQNDNKRCKASSEAEKVPLPGSSKNTEVQTKFDQSSDSSAVFHKVFCVDGVGMECHCCISSYRSKDD